MSSARNFSAALDCVRYFFQTRESLTSICGRTGLKHRSVPSVFTKLSSVRTYPIFSFAISIAVYTRLVVLLMFSSSALFPIHRKKPGEDMEFREDVPLAKKEKIHTSDLWDIPLINIE